MYLTAAVKPDQNYHQEYMGLRGDLCTTEMFWSQAGDPESSKKVGGEIVTRLGLTLHVDQLLTL